MFTPPHLPPAPLLLSSLDESASEFFSLLRQIETSLLQSSGPQSLESVLQPLSRLRSLHLTLSTFPEQIHQHEVLANRRVAFHDDRLARLRDRLRRLRARVRRTRQERASIRMPVPLPANAVDHSHIVESLQAEHSRREEMGQRVNALRSEVGKLQGEESRFSGALHALDDISVAFVGARDGVIGNASLETAFGSSSSGGDSDGISFVAPVGEGASETLEQKKMRLLPAPLYCLFHVVRDLADQLKQKSINGGGEEDEEAEGETSTSSGKPSPSQSGPVWQLEARIEGNLPQTVDRLEEDALYHQHKRRKTSEKDLLEVFPLSVRIYVRRSKSAQLGDLVSGTSRDRMIIVVCFDVHWLSNSNLVLVKGLVPADERIIRAMWYGDAGERTPNMHVLEDFDFSEEHGGPGRPYRWAQQMCGLQFYPPQIQKGKTKGDMSMQEPTMELGSVISFRDVLERVMFRSEVARTFRATIRSLKESSIPLPSSVLLTAFAETSDVDANDDAIDRSYVLVLQYSNVNVFRIEGTMEVSRYYPFEPSRFSLRLKEGRLRERGPVEGIPEEWAALSRTAGGDGDVRMRDTDGRSSRDSEEFSPSLVDLETRANLFRPKDRSELVDLVRRQFGILVNGFAELCRSEETGEEDKRPVYQ